MINLIIKNAVTPIIKVDGVDIPFVPAELDLLMTSLEVFKSTTFRFNKTGSTKQLMEIYYPLSPNTNLDLDLYIGDNGKYRLNTLLTNYLKSFV